MHIDRFCRATAPAAVLAACLMALTLAAGAQAPSADNAKGTTADVPPADKPAVPPKAPPIPAKQLFGAAGTPAPLAARAIGNYAKGCLAGATAMPIDGEAWQAMRLSRNRNWGHPKLISLLERFAVDAKRHDGWNGMLVGDISQPRGGPMLTGHASHQIGLDADIWFTPMPNRRLSATEREELSATSMLAEGGLSVDPKVWDERRARIIKRAASYPDVERVLVHPAIKKALCEVAPKLGQDREWLSRVRPYWGHHYHFHIRIACPKDSASCVKQAAVPGDDGCGKELDDWFALLTAPPKPPGPKRPPPPPLTLDGLPAECRAVIDAGKPEARKQVPVKAAN